MKMKEICVIPKMPTHLFGPKSDSAPPEAIERSLIQNSPFEPLVPNQLCVIGLYWPWFKGAKRASQIGL